MQLLKKYAAQAEEAVAVCAKLARNFYVTSSGGNLAWKLEEDLLLITPTKLYKGIFIPKIWCLLICKAMWSKGSAAAPSSATG